VNDDSITIDVGPAPVPCSSPHELKARMLEDYTRKAGTFGLPSEPAAIERLVLHDLRLADAFHRDEGPLPEKAAPSADDIAKRRAAAQAAVAEQTKGQGALTVGAAPTDWGPTLDLPASVGLSERWMLAKGRIRRVMEGASPPIKHPDGSYDFKSMTATCGYPDGAFEFLALWFSFDLRGLVQTRRHNPFFGLSHREASLKFVRLTEDICDRSTGTSMGSWFTPH
jgi:hypothetical protein